MIDLGKPFSLFANCRVIYDGRAYSILENGNYLIIYKEDGSIQIHGSNKIQPRNYQGSRSTLELRQNSLISRNKKETITVVINDIINITYLEDWSDNEISIQKTEQELVQKIFLNWNDYIDGDFEIIEKEYATDYGPVDLVGIEESGELHVVEVKRRKGTISDCTQLKRYVEALKANFGYLAAPQMGENAERYLAECGFAWIRVDFDHP